MRSDNPRKGYQMPPAPEVRPDGRQPTYPNAAREAGRKPMRIDYDLVRRVHGIEARFSDSETHRRLREVREGGYGDLHKRLAKVVNRKSDHMNDTERQVLGDFPDHGIDLGHFSKALIYAPGMTMGIRRHKAIVSLVRLGFLGIVEGTLDGKTKQVLVKLN